MAAYSVAFGIVRVLGSLYGEGVAAYVAKIIMKSDNDQRNQYRHCTYGSICLPVRVNGKQHISIRHLAAM